MGTELHIGVDTEKVVVSAYPLSARSGRLRRTRTGSLVEVFPRPPSGRSRADRVTVAARLALPLMLLSAGLAAAGMNWWLVLACSAALVTQVWRVQARAARRGVIAVPRDTESPVLWTAAERAAFERAVIASRRVRATWPALGDMIDPGSADRSLTRALGELGGVLARRQELARLCAELDGVRDADIPADSPARSAVDEQRERAEQSWRAEDAAADRILRSIDTAARAGESFIRERQVAATARYAERTLARVTGAPAVADSGPDLADRTTAVIAAYRDLAV